jgi:hypothetical protein
MIVLNLSCASGHQFEGWFASSDAFDRQLEQAQINCPHCNDTIITRLPGAPNIAKGHAQDSLPPDEHQAVAALVAELQRLGDASEDVGDRFADEVRRIHSREANERRIKGSATIDDVRELLDEGIPVLPIPPKKAGH